MEASGSTKKLAISAAQSGSGFQNRKTNGKTETVTRKKTAEQEKRQQNLSVFLLEKNVERLVIEFI